MKSIKLPVLLSQKKTDKQTRCYVVLSRNELMQALKVMDSEREANNLKMSDCIIIEGDAYLNPEQTAIQLCQGKTRLP